MELLATGREAAIHALDADRILRVPLPGQEEAAERGTALGEAAAAAGAPVPAVLGRQDGGVVLERCAGPDLLTLLERRPLAVWRVARVLGRTHAALHALAGPDALPGQHALLAERLAMERVPGDVRDTALTRLAELPHGDRLCHGDLTPANVVLDGRRGPKVIDWTLACRGVPEADVARVVLTVATGRPPGGDVVPGPLDAAGRRLLVQRYLRAYERVRPLDRGAVEAWMPVVAAARAAEDIDGSERDALLAQARAPRRLVPRAIDTAHRRWVWLNAIAVTAVINVIANAAIAWLSVRGMGDVLVWRLPLLGGTSVATDTAGTFFVLPFLTTIFTTLAIRRELRIGSFSPIAPVDDPAPLMSLLPERLLRRALAFGGLCLLAFGPPSLLALALAGPAPMSHGAFIAYKVVLGVALGLLVTPLIAVRAMAEAPALRQY